MWRSENQYILQPRGGYRGLYPEGGMVNQRGHYACTLAPIHLATTGWIQGLRRLNSHTKCPLLCVRSISLDLTIMYILSVHYSVPIFFYWSQYKNYGLNIMDTQYLEGGIGVISLRRLNSHSKCPLLCVQFVYWSLCKYFRLCNGQTVF